MQILWSKYFKVAYKEIKPKMKDNCRNDVKFDTDLNFDIPGKYFNLLENVTTPGVYSILFVVMEAQGSKCLIFLKSNTKIHKYEDVLDTYINM